MDGRRGRRLRFLFKTFKTMAKTKTEDPQLLEEEEHEEYLSYTIEKFVIIAKDNATINFTVDQFMSGKPKEIPPGP
jgi:hypothetical protein